MANAYKYIAQTGLISPDTGVIKNTVEGEWRDSIGQDLVIANNLPQGVMITGEVITRSTFTSENAEVANQVNPDESGGVFLDALCALTGIERDDAVFGVIPNVDLFGRPQTIIRAGARMQDENTPPTIWVSTRDVQLDASGHITVDFRCTVTGPISVLPDTLTKVLDDVLGWERGNNPNAAVPGKNEESDVSLRARRKLTLAKQGRSSPEAQVSDLYDTEGVQSLSYRENYTKVDKIIDGIPMVANSVWACVNGGADTDIALSLLNNKTDGAAWNGAVTVNVREPFSGQTYVVQFDRPTPIPILVRVSVRTIGTGTVVDPDTAVPDAIVRYRDGEMEGQRGFVTGGAVSPFELSAAVNYFYPTIFVSKVEIKSANDPDAQWTTTEFPIALNQIATVTEGSIQVLKPTAVLNNGSGGV